MRARLTVLLPQVGFGALLAALALVPVAFTRRSAEAFMVPKLTLLWICLALAIGGLVVQAVSERQLPWPRLSIRWPLVALVGWTALATITSRAPWMSLFGRYARYDGLLGLAAGVLVALVVVGYTWRAPHRLRWAVGAIVVGALIGHAYVNVQQLGLDWVDWRNDAGQPIDRPYGLLGNSNFSGAHLALAIPLVLAARAHLQQRRSSIALAMLAGALLLGTWWTGTRGGLLAAAGGVAAAGLLAPEVIPKAVRWAAAAATVAAVVLIVQAGITDTRGSQDQTGTPRVLQGSTLLDRREIWSGGIRMAADQPLVGVGPDAFGLAYADVRRPVSVDETPINADEAHNLWIDRLATAGLPAAAAYTWLLVMVVLAAWRARSRLEPEHRWLLAGLGGTFAGYLLQGTVSIDVVPLALIGWASLGAVVALADPAALDGRADPVAAPARRPVPATVLLGVGLGMAVIVGFAVRPLMGDLAMRRALEAANVDRDRIAAVTELQTAASWVDHEPLYRATLADQLVLIATQQAADAEVRTRLLREAVVAYEQAEQRAPGDPQLLRALARTLVILADSEPPRAREDLERASEVLGPLAARLPSDRALREEHGLLLEARSKLATGSAKQDLRDAAASEFEAALELDPTSTVGLAGLARLALIEGREADALDLFEQAAEIEPEDEGIRTAIREVEALLADAAG